MGSVLGTAAAVAVGLYGSSGGYGYNPFGGYSYSRAQSATGGVGGWQAAFASRLNAWRRPNDE